MRKKDIDIYYFSEISSTRRIASEFNIFLFQTLNLNITKNVYNFDSAISKLIKIRDEYKIKINFFIA